MPSLLRVWHVDLYGLQGTGSLAFWVLIRCGQRAARELDRLGPLSPSLSVSVCLCRGLISSDFVPLVGTAAPLGVGGSSSPAAPALGSGNFAPAPPSPAPTSPPAPSPQPQPCCGASGYFSASYWFLSTQILGDPCCLRARSPHPPVSN